ncbi:MAG: helix-turn-helix domain-containing protein [Candidatus Heimdallarchaeota archaeon]
MSTPATTPFLERIGLSEEEQKVYLALLSLGPLTLGEISKYSQVKPISKVKPILEALFAKDYAYNIIGLVDKAIGLYPFREIAEEAGKDAQKIDQLVTELKEYVANQIRHFDQVMKDTEAFVHSEKKKNSDIVSLNSNENRTTIETKSQEATQAITETVSSTTKAIKSATNRFLTKQTETVEAFEGSVNENLNTFSTNVKSNSQTALEELNATTKGRNDEFLSEGTNAIATATKTITSEVGKLGNTLKNDSKEKLEATRDHVLSGLETFVNEAEGNVTNLNETITVATNEQGAFLKKTTEEAKRNRIDLNNQFKEGLSTNFDQVKEHFTSDMSDFEGKFNKQLMKVSERYKKQIDDLNANTSQEISALMENANAAVAELVTKHNEEIAANVDIDNKAVEDGTALMIAKVEKQNAKTLDTTSSTIETLNASTVLLKSNYSADINAKVDETVTGMHASIDSSVDASKAVFNVTKKNVTEKLTTLTTTNSDTTATATAQMTTEIASMADTTVATATEKLTEAKDSFITGTKKTKQKVARDTTTGVETIGTTTTTVISEVNTTATTGIRNNEETTLKAITTITDVVESSVRKEIEAVKGGFNDYYKRFSKDSLKISQLLRAFKSQNESFQTTVTTYPRPNIETALLYSKDAIFDRLDDMLTERIKSNVTMVIPEPTDIPTKTLGKVKAQAKMTIISKIDEVSNKNIIDEIKASDELGRAKIRKIGMQDMQGYAEYIAFDRDGGEEMLIAFKDETEKDWVGILSTSDGFKNVVIGETLGRQALSISRELK